LISALGQPYTQEDFLTMLTILFKAPKGFIGCPVDSDIQVARTKDVLAHGLYTIKRAEEGAKLEVSQKA